MTKDGYEKVKDRADYAAIGGIIEGHPGELFELLQLVLPAGGSRHKAIHVQKARI